MNVSIDSEGIVMKILPKTTSKTIFAIMVLLFVVLLIGSLPAHAATLTVTDPVDANSGAVSCTLRDAIAEINTAGVAPSSCGNSGGAYGTTDTIFIPAGIYTITIAPDGTPDDNADGDFDIIKTVTIQGAGAATTIIDGANIDRVFHATVGNIAIDGVSIINGKTVNDGGGVAATNITISNSTFSGNSAGTFAGGVRANTAKISNSTFSNNNARIGGGVAATNITISNSTFSGNSAPLGGGGVFASTSTTISNSTFSGNSATGGGGGMYVGNANISNSIIANSVSGGDCFGTGALTSGGNNISSDATCNFVAAGDMINTDPLLAPLANNGGPTQTHALANTGPAIDAGTCINLADQRGIARPQGVTCDIGAYEAEQYLLTVSVAGTGTVTGAHTNFASTINCPGVCSEYFFIGGVYTLTATPGAGQGFSGWGGVCAPAGATTTCLAAPGGSVAASASFGGLGCTDPAATNYNPTATVDDGSCTYPPRKPKKRKNHSPYDPNGGGAEWLIYPGADETNVNPGTAFKWYALADDDNDEITYDPQFCDGFESGECTSWSSITQLVMTDNSTLRQAQGDKLAQGDNHLSLRGAKGDVAISGLPRSARNDSFSNTLASGGGALLFALGFIGAIRTRRGRAFMMALLLMTSGAVLTACGSDSSDDDSTAASAAITCDSVEDGVVCRTQTGLAANTDYTWRVVASDGKGGENISAIRSFTTGE